MFFFHEGKPTNIKGVLRYVVEEDSAAPTIQDVERTSIPQDHSHMCKFEDDRCPGFTLVSGALQRYAAQAPGRIRSRWQSELGEREMRKRADIQELDPNALKDLTRM